MNIIDSIKIKLKFDLATATQGTFCERVDNCLGIDREDGRVDYFLNERGEWVFISGAGGGVASVTGLDTDNSDPNNPIVRIAVDGVTITGDGTPLNPLVSVGGGGSVCADNGLSIDDNGCVVLGGTLSGNTEINGLDQHYILFGDILQGGQSVFAYGNLFDLTGDNDYGLIAFGETIQLLSPNTNNFSAFSMEPEVVDFGTFDQNTGENASFIIRSAPALGARIGVTSGNGVDENAFSINANGINTNYYNTLTGDEYSQELADNGWVWSNDAVGDLMVLTELGEFRLYAYPETRDDSATFTPANFLYTNNIGDVLSAPLSLLTGVQSITGLQVVNGTSATPHISYPDPTTMRTVLWTDLTGFTGSSASPLSGSGLAAIEFGDWAILRSSGTTSTSTLTAEVGRNGILRMGAASVGANVSLRARSINIGASKRFKTAIRIPTLSSSGQTFIVRCGDTSQNSDANDRTYFRYTDSVNGGRWQFIARDSVGNETIVDTGVTVVAGTWYLLDYFDTNNGLTLNWSINGSIPQQVTTNVPLGQNSVIQIAIEKTNGTTESTLDVDYAYYHYNR